MTDFKFVKIWQIYWPSTMSSANSLGDQSEGSELEVLDTCPKPTRKGTPLEKKWRLLWTSWMTRYSFWSLNIFKILTAFDNEAINGSLQIYISNILCLTYNIIQLNMLLLEKNILYIYNPYIIKFVVQFNVIVLQNYSHGT